VSFESGSVSCRMFFVPRALPDDAVERFASQCAPALESLKDVPIQGWVGGRHLLDRMIQEDNAYYGGYLRLSLMQAERKIPPALLKAEQTMEELAQMQATGSPALSRKVRAEIKQSIVDRLLPNMPPQLKGIQFVYDHTEQIIYADCVSEKQLDAFQIHFARAIGFALQPAMPDSAAMRLCNEDIQDWPPSSFTPDVDDSDASSHPGEEFLTWLWFVAEQERGGFDLDGQAVAVMIEGPLMFCMEGDGAHVTVLRKGSPLVSAEAKTSLMSGKKLSQAKLTLTVNDQAWVCTFDAREFVVRGLKLPDIERMDPISRFQERIRLMNEFRRFLLGAYTMFVKRRADASQWSNEVARIRQWVQDRRAAH
jgi:hypothetical protein